MASTPSSSPSRRMVSASSPPVSARCTAAPNTRSRLSRARPVPVSVGGMPRPLVGLLTSLRCKRKPYNVSQFRQGGTVTSQQEVRSGVTTMHAVVQDEYRDTADVLRLEQVARPEPGPGEVLVR